MILGHPIFTGFRRLTGCQRDPRDWGVTNMNIILRNNRLVKISQINLHPLQSQLVKNLRNIFY